MSQRCVFIIVGHAACGSQDS